MASLSMIDAVSREKEENIQPNVIFIYADDIGYGDLSCNGSTTISTPNVEALAQEGIRFTNVHSAAATSTPSRDAMLTGEYAWRKEGTGVANGDAALIISPERYTLADMFSDAGYKTGVIGKWHLGLGSVSGEQDWNSYLSPNPKDIGFNYSYIMAATGDRVPCVFVENGRVANYDAENPIYVDYNNNFEGEPTGKDNPELLKLFPSHGHDYSIINGISRIGYMKGGGKALWRDEDIADVLTQKAVEFIKSNKEAPFFLYFATQDAHVPRVPHSRFVGKSGMGARGDAILQFDWSVGEIVATLKQLELYENTIIVLSSDNGPVVDDGYKDEAVELLGDHKPGGEFRGGKYSSFEAGTRMPCVIKWRGNDIGKVNKALLSQVDWFASFARLLKIKLPEGSAPDSQNQIKTWEGQKQRGRKMLVVQNAQNVLSIVSGKWKYISPSQGESFNRWTSIETGNNPQPQLYNLSTDKGETKNLASKRRVKTARLARKLEQIRGK